MTGGGMKERKKMVGWIWNTKRREAKERGRERRIMAE